MTPDAAYIVPYGTACHLWQPFKVSVTVLMKGPNMKKITASVLLASAFVFAQAQANSSSVTGKWKVHSSIKIDVFAFILLIDDFYLYTSVRNTY